MNLLTLTVLAISIKASEGGLLSGVKPEVKQPPIPTNITSQGPDIALSKEYVYLTGAAYCFHLQNWNCIYCKKAKLMGHEFAALVKNPFSKTQALITINKLKKEIVVSYRGTFSIMNTLHDATTGVVQLNDKENGNGNPVQKYAPGISSGIAVHMGYLDAARTVYGQMIEKLTEIMLDNQNYSLVFTGHSLGAAIASLSLYQVLERVDVPNNFPNATSYSYFGYGEPRVGNRAYADYWNSKSYLQVSRIVNKKDPVCRTSAPAGFMHHGSELWITDEGDKICSKTFYEDPTCSNSIPDYALNVNDHVNYWDVSFLDCAKNNAGYVLSDFFL